MRNFAGLAVIGSMAGLDRRAGTANHSGMHAVGSLVVSIVLHDDDDMPMTCRKFVSWQWHG